MQFTNKQTNGRYFVNKREKRKKVATTTQRKKDVFERSAGSALKKNKK